MSRITKEMILGARIVDLHKTFVTVNGLNEYSVYFTVDRGFTFRTPCAGQPWETCTVPPEAEQLKDYIVRSFKYERRWWGGVRRVEDPSTVIDFVQRIKGRSIAGVYCGAFDPSVGGHHPWDGSLVLDDGSQVSNNVVAPQGTSRGGLYYFLGGSDQCKPTDRMTDYFTIPLEEDSPA